MKEFKVNEILALKLIGDKTVIFVNDNEFIHCQKLLINLDKKGHLEEHYSIDKLAEVSEAYDELYEIRIPPEREFEAHCSNFQIWYEENYNTELLHSNIAFPLLKKLVKEGDLQALKVFKEEIIKRYLHGIKSTQEFLLEEGYLDLITEQEKFSLLNSWDEEKALKKLEKLIEKQIKLDTPYNHFLQSFVLRNGTITELNLNVSNLEIIPEAIKNFKNLEVLRLSNNNLKYLPKWLPHLKNLKKFEAMYTLIEELPSSLGNLENLGILNLSQNKIKKISKIIPESYENLRELDLHNNCIRLLPKSIKNHHPLIRFFY